MIRLIRAVVVISMVSAYMAPANASIVNLYANIDASQVVGGSTSTGIGTATLTLDDVTNLLSWNVTYTGLGGPVVSLNLRGPALPSQNAAIQVNITGISGNNSPSIGSDTISEAQADDLLAGLWYVNLATAEYPDGEIRGQVQVIPIPAAVWLFGSGLLGLIGIARRKKLA